MTARLKASLSTAAVDALECAIAAAEVRDVPLLLVGGGVRDLLLGQCNDDLDLVVEGDANSLAASVAPSIDAKLTRHPRFGTATFAGEGFRLDIAGARAECYTRPGALPSVRPAGLFDDLARRDFRINAIALRLTGKDAGEVIDPQGGRRDVERRLVRVLHEASFQDDATRILRSLRYAGHLAFRLGPQTRRLLTRDVSFLDTISGARLRHEIERIAGEERVVEIIGEAAGLDVLTSIHPALRPGKRGLAALAALGELSPSHRATVLFCLLLYDAPPGDIDAAAERLALTSRQTEAVRAIPALRSCEASLAGRSLQPSEAFELLDGHPRPAMEAFALAATSKRAKERAQRYLDEWRFVRSRLNGRDVEALGVPHGPQVGEALRTLREARLDGAVNTREDETVLVQNLRHAGGRLVGTRNG